MWERSRRAAPQASRLYDFKTAAKLDGSAASDHSLHVTNVTAVALRISGVLQRCASAFFAGAANLAIHPVNKQVESEAN